MNNNQLNFVDFLSVLSFGIGLQNLNLNLTEQDITEQTQDIDARVAERTKQALAEIHEHLKNQDAKIDRILEKLEESGFGRETI